MGRPLGSTKIQSPEHLWDLFTEYKRQVKQTPILKHTFVGKEGRSEYSELERPLTIEGFECYVADLGIIGDLSHYFANTNGRYKRFLTIATRIRKEVRNDQIGGGMAGIYNPSITARLNNLVEKKEIANVEQPLFPDVQEDNGNQEDSES
jgi:hypothetical protein